MKQMEIRMEIRNMEKHMEERLDEIDASLNHLREVLADAIYKIDRMYILCCSLEDRLNLPDWKGLEAQLQILQDRFNNQANNIQKMGEKFDEIVIKNTHRLSSMINEHKGFVAQERSKASARARAILQIIQAEGTAEKDCQ